MDTVRKKRAIGDTAWRLLGAALVLAGPAWADDPPPPANQDEALKRLEQLEKEVRELKKQVREDADATKEAAKTNPKVDVGTKGLTVTSADGAHQFQVGLRLSMDAGWIFDSNGLNSAIVAPATKPIFPKPNDGVDFRMARLVLRGYVFNDFKYVFETDFAGEKDGADTPKFRDVYIEYDKIPYGDGRKFALRFGNFKEPFNLDDQTSTPDLVFMEKALTDVFVPSRNVGFMLSDALFGDEKKERMTWAIGVFKEVDDIPNPADSNDTKGYQGAVRVTGLPWFDKGGRRLIHLGLGYSHRNLDGNTLDYSARSESRLVVSRYVDPNLGAIDKAAVLPAGVQRLNSTGPQTADLFDAEIAGVIGPFWWQAEYLNSLVNTKTADSLDFYGYYAEAGYIITGEHRPYNTAKGVFTAPIPKKNFNPFGEGRGWGAWEVAARYSSVYLNDGPVRGGKQTAYTAALNWYINPNIRWGLNYIFNDVKNDFYDGNFSVLQTRLQLSF